MCYAVTETTEKEDSSLFFHSPCSQFSPVPPSSSCSLKTKLFLSQAEGGCVLVSLFVTQKNSFRQDVCEDGLVGGAILGVIECQCLGFRLLFLGRKSQLYGHLVKSPALSRWLAWSFQLAQTLINFRYLALSKLLACSYV